ncbi:MAG: diguanylate cyclase [Betaproteobacteria bacterium]|nr:diguanylate cyclase [Betaproteobacteria bacterium]
MSYLPDSFRMRLALLFGGLTLLVGLPVYWYVDKVFANQLVVERGNSLRDLAAAVSTVVAENIRERQREIDLLAQTPLYRRAPLDHPDVMKSLDRVQKSYPYYTWIGVTDAEGKVQSATKGMLAGANVAKRPWFINGLEGSFVGDLHEAVLLAKLIPTDPGRGPMRFIDFAAPVYDDQNRLRGVLGAHAEWRWATDVVNVMMPRNSAATGMEVFIVNRDSAIIYPDVGENRPKSLPASIDTSRPFVLDDWATGTSYVSTVVPVRELLPNKPVSWRIAVRQPASETLAAVDALQKAMLILAAAAITILLILTFWVASVLSRPLERLAKQAKRIEQGDEAASLENSTDVSELRNLTEALRGMTDKLIQRREALAESNLQLEHKVSERTAELATANAQLRLQARRDALTGLDNRLAVNERLHEEFLRMKRSKRPYAVLLMDIDYFKRINDTHGHAVGDEVLVAVAQLLKASLRESDFVARHGGEEFIALLIDTDSHHAAQVAEKIRAVIAAAKLPTVGHVTISIGVAMATPDDADEDESVRDADHYLYEAKRAGRNRVVTSHAPLAAE